MHELVRLLLVCQVASGCSHLIVLLQHGSCIVEGLSGCVEHIFRDAHISHVGVLSDVWVHALVQHSSASSLLVHLALTSTQKHGAGFNDHTSN